MAISIPRRTLLRGAGACLALPLLEIMHSQRAAAQTVPVQRFIAFFYPNGTDPRKWNPAAGALTAASLPECLKDLGGFAAEGIWPAGDATFQDITAVTGIDHSGVCVDIHMPSMALSAHKGVANNYTPPQPTLDQYLAERLQATTPYRNLALSATGSTDQCAKTVAAQLDLGADGVILHGASPHELAPIVDSYRAIRTGSETERKPDDPTVR